MDHCYKVIFELDGVEMLNTLLNLNSAIDLSFDRRAEGVESYLDAFVNSNIESLEESKHVGFSNVVVSVPEKLMNVSDIKPKKWRLPTSYEHVETKEGTDDNIIRISGTRTPELKLSGKKALLRTSESGKAMKDFDEAVRRMCHDDILRKCKLCLETHVTNFELRAWCKEKLKELGS